MSSSPFLVVVVVDAPSFVLTHLLGYVCVCVGDVVAVGSRPRWRSVMWHLRRAAGSAFGLGYLE